MKFIFILCCIAVPAAFADQINPLQNAVELDRARSAWNFGGQHPIKRSTYWNRPRNVAGPGSVLANRRSGVGSAPMAPHAKKSAASKRSRLQKPFPQRPTYQGQSRQVTKRNTSPLPFPQQPSGYPQTYPMSYYPNQPRFPASPWYRSSRKLRPAVDPIKSRFMKEQLWHLDKGEGYALKDEDLDRDSRLRSRRYGTETNEIDQHQPISNVQQHKHKLEKDAENVVLKAETAEKNLGSSEHGVLQPQHIHHHHHYGAINDAAKHRTPNLTRRRRRRSADMQMPNDAQTQTLLQQIFGGNQRMTPVVTRKHYSSHVGNGKNPNSHPANPNYKIPATIIAPPQFDKDDVLNMLMGSAGVSADAMGHVVATNNRYVRFGRGLPNGRGGRHLQWGDNSKTRNALQSPAQQNIKPVAKYPKKPLPPAKKPMVQLTPPPNTPTKQSQVPPPVILNFQISPMPSPRLNNGPIVTVPIPTQQQEVVIQQQPIVPKNQQRIVEKPIVQEIQSAFIKPEESQATPVIEDIAPLEMVYVFPSEKSMKLDLDPFEYAEWMPVYMRKSKPNKKFNYDLVSRKAELSKSNKVQPYAGKQEIGDETMTSFNYQNINDQLVDSEIDTSSVGSAGDYLDSFGDSLDIELSSLISGSNDNGENGLLDSTAPYYPINSKPPSTSWQDILNQANTDILPKKLSYAVRNTDKDELDSILHDITSRETEALVQNEYIYSNDNLNNDNNYDDSYINNQSDK